MEGERVWKSAVEAVEEFEGPLRKRIVCPGGG